MINLIRAIVEQLLQTYDFDTVVKLLRAMTGHSEQLIRAILATAGF